MIQSHSPANGVKPRVLIVDDEEAVRIALRAILQSDYEVSEADCAGKGLEMLKMAHADLITLDLRMPGQSGLDALKAIREWDEYTDTPVIMITGHASLDSACEAFRLGATDYLQKPFGVDQLKTSVRNGLRRHETGLLPKLEKRSPQMMPVPLAQEEPREVSPENLARLGKASAAFVHDLASPLQVLTILSSLCSTKLLAEASPERDQELFEAVEQMGRLLSWSGELVKGWQTIAVPSQSCRELLDVEPLLDRVIELVEPYARLNGVTLTRAALPRNMEVYGDRIQLERALVNISLNGIKASTSGGRTLEVSAVPFNNSHVLRFSDSGQGFSHERMKEVLNGDPFSSVAGKSRRGLGLFIADWIAVNHGGKLQFLCEKGRGTTVEFFLPAPIANGHTFGFGR